LIQNERHVACRVEQNVHGQSARVGIGGNRRCRARGRIRIDQRQVPIIKIDAKRSHVVPKTVAPLDQHIQNSRGPGRGTATVEQKHTQGANAYEYNRSAYFLQHLLSQGVPYRRAFRRLEESAASRRPAMPCQPSRRLKLVAEIYLFIRNWREEQILKSKPGSSRNPDFNL